MDIFQKYDQITVKIECNGNKGSGCLFQPHTNEYTYVFTAKHCLEGKEGNKKAFEIGDIIVERIEKIHHSVSLLKVVDYILHPQLDLALLKVEYVSDTPQINLSKPIYKSPVTIYGYPGLISTQEDNKQKINCLVDLCPEIEPKFELTTQQNLTSYYLGLDEVMEGLSGSGIFIESGNELSLIGIFTSLKAPGGAYQGLVGKKVENFNPMLHQLKLQELQIFDNPSSHDASHKTLSTDPITFYEEDIKELIVHFSSIATNFTRYPDLPDIDLVGKNELNNLSVGYFKEMVDKHLHYFPKINAFLTDPLNAEYLEMYLATTEELQFKITAQRYGFGKFEEIFIHLHDYILSKLPELRTKRRMIWVFLHFMYYSCDIGDKHVKTS